MQFCFIEPERTTNSSAILSYKVELPLDPNLKRPLIFAIHTISTWMETASFQGLKLPTQILMNSQKRSSMHSDSTSCYTIAKIKQKTQKPFTSDLPASARICVTSPLFTRSLSSISFLIFLSCRVCSFHYSESRKRPAENLGKSTRLLPIFPI